MPDLRSMIGDDIIALMPLWDKLKLQEVKLLGVEEGGVWIESQKFTDQFLDKIQVSSAPKSMVFFMPFAQISFIAASVVQPAPGDETRTDR
jgi:hypothetical protein